jgi:uncharacterized protein YpmS
MCRYACTVTISSEIERILNSALKNYFHAEQYSVYINDSRVELPNSVDFSSFLRVRILKELSIKVRAGRSGS